MDRSKTSVFVSYRRDSASFIASAMFHYLTPRGYDIFLDVESLGQGKFPEKVLSEIVKREFFVVILTPGSTERCLQEGDWLRLEIEQAIAASRKIIPILVEGFTFKEATHHLTEKLSELKDYNALELTKTSFRETMRLLEERFLTERNTPSQMQVPPNDTYYISHLDPSINRPGNDTFLRAVFIHKMLATPEEIDLAIEGYSETLKMFPLHVEAYIMRGMAYMERGRFQESLQDYQFALKLQADNPVVYTNQALTHIYINNFDQAIEDATKAIDLKADIPEAYGNRGMAYFHLKQWDKALEDFNNALVIKPDFAIGLNNRGAVYREKGLHEAALTELDKAIAIDPNLSVAYFNKALTLYLMGKFESAIINYTRAIELNYRDLALTYNNRAICRQRINDINGALHDINFAIKLAPNNPDHYINRGVFKSLKGEDISALSDLATALKLNPQNKEIYFLIGVIQYRLKLYSDSKSAFDKALELQLDTEEFFNHYGLTLQELNEHESALEIFSRVIQINSTKPNYFYNRADSYSKLNRKELAIQDYQRYLDLGGGIVDNDQAEVEEIILKLKSDLAT